MKFVLFSDVHIGGRFNEQMFNKGVEFINSVESDYVIFGGDLTEQGTLKEYRLATEKYLPMIKQETFMIPGNHDVKNVGDLLWEEFIGPRYFVQTNEQEKIKILGLDSNEPDKNTGRMGEKAIDRIYQEFEDLDDSWTQVLVFHHQSLPIKYTGRERSAIIDAGDVIKAILDCNIDMVFNGHRHISNVYTLTDGDVVTLVVNIGTMSCKKTRYREEYSVTVVEYDKDTGESSVDVHLLNSPDNTVKNKFKGELNTINHPSDIGNPITTIVQIGNSDFTPNGFNLENYSRATKIINSLDDCDIIIHTGDVTKSSYENEFQLAQVLLGQFSKPLVVLPGPRDYFALGTELFPKYIGEKTQDFENDELKLLGMNTCILEDKIGRLGRSATARMIDEFTGIDKLKAVAFHHTLIPLPRTKHESELQDAGDVLAKIVENGIDLVLTGAKNRSGCWQIGNTIFVNAGTISSKNIVTPQGNSFNIINIYNTETGRYFKIDECFAATGEIKPLGRFFVSEDAPLPV